MLVNFLITMTKYPSEEPKGRKCPSWQQECGAAGYIVPIVSRQRQRLVLNSCLVFFFLFYNICNL